MKKIFLTFLLINLLVIPALASAQGGLVPCGNGYPTDPDFRPCTLSDFFTMILYIYNTIVYLSVPLAGLMVVIGGVLIMISGGPGGKNPVTGIVSPNLYSQARNMVWGAVIGILLIFCSWVIIKAVLTAIGYVGPF